MIWWIVNIFPSSSILVPFWQSNNPVYNQKWSKAYWQYISAHHPQSFRKVCHILPIIFFNKITLKQKQGWTHVFENFICHGTSKVLKIRISLGLSQLVIRKLKDTQNICPSCNFTNQNITHLLKSCQNWSIFAATGL